MPPKTIEVQNFTEATGFFPVYDGQSSYDNDSITNEYRRIKRFLAPQAIQFENLYFIGSYLQDLQPEEDVAEITQQVYERISPAKEVRVTMLHERFAGEYMNTARTILRYPHGTTAFCKLGQLMLAHEHLDLTHEHRRLIVGRAATVLSNFMEFEDFDGVRTSMPDDSMVEKDEVLKEKLLLEFGDGDDTQVERIFFGKNRTSTFSAKFGINNDQLYEATAKADGTGCYAFAELDNVIFPLWLYGGHVSVESPVMLSESGSRIYGAFMNAIAESNLQ